MGISFWIIQVGPKSNDKSPGKRHTEKRGAIWPESRDRSDAVIWSLCREEGPADTLILNFCPPRTVRK